MSNLIFLHVICTQLTCHASYFEVLQYSSTLNTVQIELYLKKRSTSKYIRSANQTGGRTGSASWAVGKLSERFAFWVGITPYTNSRETTRLSRLSRESFRLSRLSNSLHRRHSISLYMLKIHCQRRSVCWPQVRLQMQAQVRAQLKRHSGQQKTH